METKSRLHKCSFQPTQIVCLASSNHVLYGEVIKIIVEKELCWVRPLILAEILEEFSDFSSSLKDTQVIDLRYTSDLFYPIRYFRPALDTEVLPLWDYLMTSDIDFDKISENRLQLNSFLKQFHNN
jgi:hypothetical protein